MMNRARKWRLLLSAAVVVVVATLGLAACGGGDKETNGGTTGGGEPKAGGTYNFPIAANPVSIEPLNAQETEGMHVTHQAFEGLVKYVLGDDGNMKVEPCIAESWEANEDATVFTFKLKKGVMFQPPVNREVKAQDFVDSWNRVTLEENASDVSYILAAIKGCEDTGYQTDPAAGLTGLKALDDYTLEVTLRYSFAEFPDTLGHSVAAVTPVDYIEEISPKAYFKKPVGTGPYMVEEWVDNQKIELVKNPEYWDKENAGYVDRIHMPIILEASTEWLEFQKGTVDMCRVPPGQVKPAENNPKVQSGEWSTKKWPQTSTYFVFVNMANSTMGNDAELRQALAYSANAEAVINVAREGVPTPATGIIPPGTPGFREGQSPYGYNPDKAKELLGGKTASINYWYNTDEAHQKVAEVLQAGWKSVGIDVKLSNFEWGTYLDKLSNNDKPGSPEVFRLGWVTDYPSMDGWVYPLFHSSQKGSNNYSFYDNPEVDKLMVDARSETDATKRQDMYAEAEQIVLKDVAVIPIYFYREFRVMNNRVQNQILNPMNFVDMWTVWVK